MCVARAGLDVVTLSFLDTATDHSVTIRTTATMSHFFYFTAAILKITVVRFGLEHATLKLVIVICIIQIILFH